MTEPKNYYDPNDTRRFVDRYRQDVLVDERDRLADRVRELEGWQEEALLDVIHTEAENTRLRERVQELERQCRETNEILTDRNNDLFTEHQENIRLLEALESVAVNEKFGVLYTLV